MFLVAWALSAALEADRWIHVGRSQSGYEEYVDKDSITRIGDKVIAWTRRDLGLEHSTIWHELEFDCLRRTETILAYIRDDKGTVSHNVARPHRAASPVPPGSVQEKIFNLACR
jgi:hypothetical protein